MAKKYTEEFIKNFVINNGYRFIELLSENYGIKCYIKIWCGNPNHEPYKVKFENFYGNKGLNGTRCKKCYEENKYWNIDKIINFVENEGYQILKIYEYNYQLTRLLVWCGNPNHKPYEIAFCDFKGRSNREGNRCKLCFIERKREGQRIWTEETMKQFVEQNGYTFIKLKEFNNNKSIIEIWCGNPNHNSYEVRFDVFKGSKDKEGTRCPYCNESKGEKRINNFLLNNNINYLVQYRFDDCKFKYTLPFDFYLPKYNCCIEFDGGQHYKIIDWFGGLDGFIDTKIRDTIKNIYCQQNNIKLIRIPYWNFDNIEEILTKELNL